MTSHNPGLDDYSVVLCTGSAWAVGVNMEREEGKHASDKSRWNRVGTYLPRQVGRQVLTYLGFHNYLAAASDELR